MQITIVIVIVIIIVRAGVTTSGYFLPGAKLMVGESRGRGTFQHRDSH